MRVVVVALECIMIIEVSKDRVEQVEWVSKSIMVKGPVVVGVTRGVGAIIFPAPTLSIPAGQFLCILFTGWPDSMQIIHLAR